jgi:hypothetical protein
LSAYNFRLHEAVVEALEQALVEETENLVRDLNADFGGYRYRQGRIHGLQEAVLVVEATRRKHLEG